MKSTAGDAVTTAAAMASLVWSFRGGRGPVELLYAPSTAFK